MGWLRWVVAALAASEAGFMAFDGVRSVLVGDYVTPRSGPHAGQLGPWTKLAKAIGIEPRSTLMKSIFVVYGGAWIGVIWAYLAGASWAPGAMAGFAAGSLWYLWVGTVSSALQLVMLGVMALAA